MDLFRVGVTVDNPTFKLLLSRLISVLNSPGAFLDDTQLTLCLSILPLRRLFVLDPCATKIFFQRDDGLKIICTTNNGRFDLLHINGDDLHHATAEVACFVLHTSSSQHYSMLCIDLVQSALCGKLCLYHYDSMSGSSHREMAIASCDVLARHLGYKTAQMQVTLYSHAQKETNCGVSVLAVLCGIESGLSMAGADRHATYGRICKEVLQSDAIVAMVRTQLSDEMNTMQCTLALREDPRSQSLINTKRLGALSLADIYAVFRSGTISTALLHIILTDVFGGYFAVVGPGENHAVVLASSSSPVVVLVLDVDCALVAVQKTPERAGEYVLLHCGPSHEMRELRKLFCVLPPNVTATSYACDVPLLQGTLYTLFWLRWRAVLGLALLTGCEVVEFLRDHFSDVDPNAKDKTNERLCAIALQVCSSSMYIYHAQLYGVATGAYEVPKQEQHNRARANELVDQLREMLFKIGPRSCALTDSRRMAELYCDSVSDQMLLLSTQKCQELWRLVLGDASLMAIADALLQFVFNALMLQWPILFKTKTPVSDCLFDLTCKGRYSLRVPDSPSTLTDLLSMLRVYKYELIMFPVVVYSVRVQQQQPPPPPRKEVKTDFTGADEVSDFLSSSSSRQCAPSRFTHMKSSGFIGSKTVQPARLEKDSYELVDIVSLATALELIKKHGAVPRARCYLVKMMPPHPPTAAMFCMRTHVQTQCRKFGFPLEQLDVHPMQTDQVTAVVKLIRDYIVFYMADMPSVFLNNYNPDEK